MKKIGAKITGEQTLKAPVEWKDVIDRLEKTRGVFEKGGDLSEEDRKKALKDRARTLAREPEKINPAETYLEVLEFVLAQERYAIETIYIREVYPMKDLTVLPCTPSFILGIINARGRIVSVMDIKKIFDLPERGITNLNRVIVVQEGDMELGILADEINGIRNIPESGLNPPLSTMSGIHAGYIKGVTGEGIILLDMERFLNDKQLIVHEEVGTRAHP